ncbi:FAD-binding protein [Radicibacter daui]|uniref:FAD-binding protein n=1 Tax=Radicibacter daui TaxID=3064829 RepID=UPI004046CE67
MKLSGWGQFPVVSCTLERPRVQADLQALLARGHGPVIARGMGRSYGDSALNPAMTIDMTGFCRMLAFDPVTGLLEAEAGLLLADIIAAFLPRGWFPPVTPGTRFVTLGGMIAADVHGKNHHRHGSLGNFVEWLDLLGPKGEILRCSRQENPELFARTLGGMGLTGIILRAALRLLPVETGWIRQRTLVQPDLEGVMAAFESSQDATYSVAWIDCLARGNALGRSLLFLGEHARRRELPDRLAAQPFSVPSRRGWSLPFALPAGLLNRYSVRAFNALYYQAGRRALTERLVDWERYFYPLDALAHWHRLYGRRGLVQFQCVIPLASARTGIARLLETIADAGRGSFLAVLKRLGAQESFFSFPMEGYTLALDFPVNDTTLALMQRLDAVTLEHGGRFYLAKDARLARETLEASDARVGSFRDFRRISGAGQSFASLQSGRLSL